MNLQTENTKLNCWGIYTKQTWKLFFYQTHRLNSMRFFVCVRHISASLYYSTIRLSFHWLFLFVCTVVSADEIHEWNESWMYNPHDGRVCVLAVVNVEIFRSLRIVFQRCALCATSFKLNHWSARKYFTGENSRCPYSFCAGISRNLKQNEFAYYYSCLFDLDFLLHRFKHLHRLHRAIGLSGVHLQFSKYAKDTQKPDQAFEFT